MPILRGFSFGVTLIFLCAVSSFAQTLSPGASEVAREIGILPAVETLLSLPPEVRNSTVMSTEVLSLRQQITEAVITSSLEIDGVIAEIDNELGQIAAVRAQLEARRDRALAIGTIANIVAGGATGILGTSLQFKDTTQKAGNIIGVAGGGVSTFLSILGIRQQRGGKAPLGIAPNMLAKILDRPGEFHSNYPDDVWKYLSAAPPLESTAGSRRDQLIKNWTQTGRIDQAAPSSNKVILMTSGPQDKVKLTIDSLTDRAAMLSDVKAKVSLMKRDLSKLMLAIRTTR